MAAKIGLVALTAGVGHLLTGGAFGYTLFVMTWGPVATIAVCGGTSVRRMLLMTAGVGGALGWPFFIRLALPAAVSTIAWCVLFNATAMATAALLRRTPIGRTGADTIAVLTWLTWLTGPMLMPAALIGAVGDTGLASLIARHPLPVMNALDPGAGDWTHQAVAYHWLTRLGQDVAYDLPTHGKACFVMHMAWIVLSVMAALFLAALRVVRLPSGRAEREV